MNTKPFELPTSFTPEQLQVMRTLVAVAQKKRDVKSFGLHNLEQKLAGYLDAARAANQRTVRAS